MICIQYLHFLEDIICTFNLLIINSSSMVKKKLHFMVKRKGLLLEDQKESTFDEKCEREWLFQPAMSCSYDAPPSLEHIPLSQRCRQPPRSDSHSQNHRLTPPLHATVINEYDNCDSQVNYSSYSTSSFICFFCFISPIQSF